MLVGGSQDVSSWEAVHSSVWPGSKCRGEPWSIGLDGTLVNWRRAGWRVGGVGVPIRELSWWKGSCVLRAPPALCDTPEEEANTWEDQAPRVQGRGRPLRISLLEAGVMMSGLRRGPTRLRGPEPWVRRTADITLPAAIVMLGTLSCCLRPEAVPAATGASEQAGKRLAYQRRHRIE